MIERWLPSPIFGDRYEVSSEGRVRSARGIKTPYPDKDGYPVGKVQNHSHKKLHGTHLAGERHPRAILSANDVAAIRARLSLGERPYLIARDFRINRRTVSDILHGRRWRSAVGESPVPNGDAPETNSNPNTIGETK